MHMAHGQFSPEMPLTLYISLCRSMRKKDTVGIPAMMTQTGLMHQSVQFDLSLISHKGIIAP